MWALDHYSDAETLNLTGAEVSVKEMATAIATAVGYDGEIIFNPEQPDGPLRVALSDAKFRRLNPDYVATPFETAVRESVEGSVGGSDATDGGDTEADGATKRLLAAANDGGARGAGAAEGAGGAGVVGVVGVVGAAVVAARVERFYAAMEEMPLVAILRGIEPSQAVEVGQCLVDAGIRVIEVPMNSPRPCESIRLIQESVGDRAVVGAGTVLTTADVDAVAAAGGTLIVSPNVNPVVIRHSCTRGLVSVPGYTTVSEALSALESGSHALKLFPAEGVPPAVLRASRAILPKGVRVVVVGGVKGLDTMRPYWDVGAAGFGMGSAIFKPGMTTAEVREKADGLVGAIAELRG